MLPPRRLPAKAYLAVVGTRSVVGECVLGPPVGQFAGFQANATWVMSCPSVSNVQVL